MGCSEGWGKKGVPEVCLRHLGYLTEHLEFQEELSGIQKVWEDMYV